MVVYPGTSLHHVNPVTRGVRSGVIFLGAEHGARRRSKNASFRSRYGDQPGESGIAEPRGGGEPDELLSQFAASLCGSVAVMNRHSCRILCQALLLTTLYGLGHAAASADPEPVSRIAVVFVKPEKFTDVRRCRLQAELRRPPRCHRKVHARNGRGDYPAGYESGYQSHRH